VHRDRLDITAPPGPAVVQEAALYHRAVRDRCAVAGDDQVQAAECVIPVVVVEAAVEGSSGRRSAVGVMRTVATPGISSGCMSKIMTCGVVDLLLFRSRRPRSLLAR
jgi:hypothetical protein